MTESDYIASRIAVAILQGAGREIEALNLEAMAERAGDRTLDDLSRQAAATETRSLEVAGALIVPIAIEAARQLWAAYQKKFLEEAGADAAKATLAKLKRWLSTPEAEAATDRGAPLAAAIRQVGQERGLEPEDIEALVAATTPERLARTLADG